MIYEFLRLHNFQNISPQQSYIIIDILTTHFYSVFGKTCENVRNYKSIHIVTSKKQAKRLTERVQYKSMTIISPTLVIIESEKMEITLCKPIYAGMVSNI